jgi:O-antigen ligase
VRSLVSTRASTARPPAADSHPAPAVRRLDDRLFIACGLAWVTGLIHVEAAIQHLDEYVLYAAFFVLLAAAQCMWGIAVYRSPTRKLLSAGAIVSIMVAALWILSRTSGLPVGPQPWTPEPIGAVDSIATANEVALALLVFFQVRRGRPGVLVRGCTRLTTATALCLILFSSLALMGGHAH